MAKNIFAKIVGNSILENTATKFTTKIYNMSNTVAQKNTNVKAAKSHTSSSKLKFAFTKKNYVLLIIGVVTLIVGYLLMSGGGDPDPKVFDESMFSFRRITLAPIVILLGYAVLGYAIMSKPDKPQA